MNDGMDVRVDLDYNRVGMNHTRRYVADRMNADEEGLTARGFACLLQLWDGQEVDPVDAEYLTDPREPEPLALMVDGRPQLTDLGRKIAVLADGGQVEAIYALTTMPELNN